MNIENDIFNHFLLLKKKRHPSWSLLELKKWRMRCTALGLQMVTLIPRYRPQTAKDLEPGAASASTERRREITEKAPCQVKKGNECTAKDKRSHWVNKQGKGFPKKKKKVHKCCMVEKKCNLSRVVMQDFRKLLSMCRPACVSMRERKENTVCPPRRRGNLILPACRQVSERSDCQLSKKLGARTACYPLRTLSQQNGPEPGRQKMPWSP